MARVKRGSEILKKAELRAVGLKVISPNLDLGYSLTLEAFTTAIAELRAKLNTYNMLLSTVDGAQCEVVALEKALQELNSRMLLGVASKYGKDSYEYQQAGGVRKSERKRPVRKTATRTKQAGTK
ncbi:hypothetical protein [Leptolyngbya sp. FACHB-261]|uniref:hypothetical protein n=1 Tax=Leptolyngbya sp. FACHB-261 TaxID=2692806 RepID=UPI00168340BD|nr:hypothetical protein [Leptolyngbya sp. FACHB-261]MBD2102750.1 hypothetical protein [Leptolyngbya sp. FACHB-261]